MIRFWEKRLKTGIVTERPEYEVRMKALRREIKDAVKKKFAGALAIRMVDSGSCNACGAECNALSTPITISSGCWRFCKRFDMSLF